MREDKETRIAEILEASKGILDLVYEICPFEGDATRRLQKAIKSLERQSTDEGRKNEGK